LILFSIALGQFGLRVEQIHVRRPAMHEQRNHRGGSGRRLRRSRFQVVEFYVCRLGRGRAKQSLLLQHPRQRDSADAKSVALQKASSRGGLGHGVE